MTGASGSLTAVLSTRWNPQPVNWGLDTSFASPADEINNSEDYVAFKRTISVFSLALTLVENDATHAFWCDSCIC